MSSFPSAPQIGFDKARFADDGPPPDSCRFCQRGLAGEYFRIAGHMACSTCAQNASSLVPPDTHKAYSKALLYGAAAAVAGCIGYALFGILTGIALGWAAIGVGWLVGKAMRTGSGGLGGRRYQVTAALLTYAAVAIAFVPMALHDMDRERQGHAASENAAQHTDAQQAAHAEQKASRETGKPASSEPGMLLSIVILLGIGLISPFLQFSGSVGSGLLNLFILFLGVRMAWQMSASGRLTVEGPYQS
jgi:hypothetical protein